MLIVGINTLQTINLLYLCDKVIADSVCALDRENVVRIDGTFGKKIASSDNVTFLNTHTRAVRNLVQFFFIGKVFTCSGKGHYADKAALLTVLNGNLTCDLGNDCVMLGLSCLKQFFNSGKTLSNILCRCDTTGMEGSHGKLSTGLTDGLSGNNTNSLTDCDCLTCCEVGAVALGADSLLGFTLKDRTDLDLFCARFNDLLGVKLVNDLIAADYYFTILVNEVFNKVTTYKTLCKRLDHFLAFLDVADLDALGSSTVMLVDNNFLRNVNKTTGKVTRVSGSQSGIGKTLTSTLRRNEVFENVKSFTIVSLDRNLNGTTRGVGDKSTHTCQLLDLVDATTSSRVSHHPDRIVLIKVCGKRIRNKLCGFCPGVDNKLIALLVGEEASVILLSNFNDSLVCLSNELFLLGRNLSVANRNGDSASC